MFRISKGMSFNSKSNHQATRFSQEGIVFLLTLLMFVSFTLLLPNFLTGGNVIALLRSVSVLGILALGMAIVVIGRGVDLTMVSTLVVGMVWSVKMANEGVPFGLSLFYGALLVLAFGLIVGLIVAYAEIPPIFTTLAMAPVIFGVGNPFLFKKDTHNAPSDIGWLTELGFGATFGIPNTIMVFVVLALVVHVILRYTTYGRSIQAMGDNPQTARLTGLPVRPIMVAQYMSTALIAFLVGLVIVASNSGINSRLAYTTLVYDVLLVVVLGGIGLSGGRGGVRNVIVGTLFVGTLMSGMTILNLSYTSQNFIKSLVMLLALIADTFANPRDEQTSQQGDI